MTHMEGTIDVRIREGDKEFFGVLEVYIRLKWLRSLPNFGDLLLHLEQLVSSDE